MCYAKCNQNQFLVKGLGPWACNTIAVNDPHCYHYCYLLCGYVPRDKQQMSIEDMVKELKSTFLVR
jgi:hypothetical protein